MYLGPHHFQVQSRYFEDSIRFVTNALWFESWGLAGMVLDPEALRNGTVSVVHARGILPDGLPFHMPEADALPAARNIADVFPPSREKVAVFLAIPERRQGGLNCVASEESGGQTTRYIAEPSVLHDETTGMDEKAVRIGRKNIRLLLDTESTEGLVTLPIARVMRDYSGHFVFDETFIPPCVQIGASERLMSVLGRLVEILDEKSTAMARSKQTGSKTWAEFSTRDIANFWFLHTVNSALAPLRHLFHTKRGHPEELYSGMARLGGALCTFALDSHPRQIPLYDHRRLDEVFGDLDHHIRTHLETIVPTNCISIPLTRSADYFYEGQITDTRCFGNSRWLLAIYSPVGKVELIANTPKIVKICSKAFVPELVKRALPGMALTHLPIPPSAVAARVEWQYFGINKSGPCWDHLGQTRQVGAYVPGEFPDAQLELLVILDS